MAAKVVMFVDDEERLRKMVSAYLGRKGYEVTTAANGDEALHAIAKRIPDLVIADVNMPVMDGLELTRRLRATTRASTLPILLLSALKQEDQMLGGYEAGADDYVTKPVEMTLLAAKVEALLRRPSVPPATGNGPSHGRVITFAHAKGCVGATTLAVNIAVAIGDRSMERCQIIDASLPVGDVAVLLNIHPRRTLADVALDGARVDAEVLRGVSVIHDSGLSLVAAPASPMDAERITGEIVRATIEAARAESENVYVDTGCTLNEPTLVAMDAADRICVVTEPHISSVLATKQLLAVLDRMSIAEERVQVVINRTTPRGVDDGEIWKVFNVAPGKVVPYSEAMWSAGDEGRPLVLARPESAAAIAIRDLAENLRERAGALRAA